MTERTVWLTDGRMLYDDEGAVSCGTANGATYLARRHNETVAALREAQAVIEAVTETWESWGRLDFRLPKCASIINVMRRALRAALDTGK